jgi:sugar phosphate permease
MTDPNSAPTPSDIASPRTDQDSYRWIILTLLWLLYTAFGMVARAIFPLVTPIIDDLQLSYSQMGIILGSWQLTYILVAMAAGTVLDRWGVHKSILAGAAIIGLSAALRCFANDFAIMLIAVALFGVGGPMISIGGPKTISEWFHGKSRGTAIGIYTTGPWIGGLFAVALTNSWVMPLVGNSWRLTFVVYGLYTMGVGILWGILARKCGPPAPDEGPGIYPVFRGLFGVRNVQALLLMALLAFAIGHGFSSWLPNILENTGMSASQAGFAASIPLATGIPAILLIPRFVPSRLRGYMIAIFGLLTTVNLVLVMFASGVALYTALATLGFISAPFMSLMLLILMDTREVDSKTMGAAGGMFYCVAEIGGFTGPLLMGVLVDATGTFLAGTFFLASLCIAISGLTFLLKTRY